MHIPRWLIDVLIELFNLRLILHTVKAHNAHLSVRHQITYCKLNMRGWLMLCVILFADYANVLQAI